MDVDRGTKPKSIFDIPRPVAPVEEVKPKRKRSKTPSINKKKRPKVAKAGGVEVSQKTSVNGRKQLTLKHKGGLTQEITIYTGDQKPRGAKAKGQTATWNMKPSKFKQSRGLRDDRVYLQPPKREYFGNRYKSALDKIKIDQKVAEAGASKNKEIADVRDRANREKRELEIRGKAKEDTISELKRERAGIVASHNVSQRNQSKATILGGDVGELNKLINRRGYNAIRGLVIKGEIADASTIYQLNLSSGQIDKLIKILEGETADFVKGSGVVYVTQKGVTEDGKILSETEKFVVVERQTDGRKVKVPKSQIQSGVAVAEARSRSRDPSVATGVVPPPAQLFSPRPEGSSADERPEWRQRTARRPDLGRPRKTSDRPPRDKSQPRFVGEADLEAQIEAIGGLSSSSGSEKESDTPKTGLTKARLVLQKTLRQTTSSTTKVSPAPSLLRTPSPTPFLDSLRAEAEEEKRSASPEALPAAIVEEEEEESDISEQFSGREDAPSGTDLELSPGGEAELARIEAEERRSQFLDAPRQTGGGGGTFRVNPLALSASRLQSEVDRIEDGTSAYSIRELKSMIDLVSDTDPSKPFLVSSFQTFADRVSGRSDELRRQRSGGNLGVSPKLIALRKASRERSRSVDRAEEGPTPEPEPVAETQRSPVSEIQFLTVKETKERVRDKNVIKFVDNRKENQRGAGRQRQFPTLTINRSVIVEAINSTTKGKEKQTLLRKLDGAVEGDGSLYSNNQKILEKLFGS